MDWKKYLMRVFRNENIQVFLLFLAGMAIMTVIARMADSFMLPQVSVGKAEEMRLQYPMEIEGRIQAKGKQALYCRENLRVAQVLVQKGDIVKKGDVLFTIDIEDLQDQIQQAEQEMLKYDLQIEDLECTYQKQAAQQAQNYSRAKEDYQDAQKSAGAAVEAAYQEMEKARAELAQHEAAKPESGEGSQSAEGESDGGSQSAGGESDGGSQSAELEGVSECEYTLKIGARERVSRVRKQEENVSAKLEINGADAAAGSEAREEGQSEIGMRAKVGGGSQSENIMEAESGRSSQAAEEISPIEAWSQKREELAQQYAEKQKCYQEALAAKEEAIKSASRQMEDCSESISRDNAIELLQLEKEKLSLSIKGLEELKQADGKICAEADGEIAECALSVGAMTTSEPSLLFEDFSQPLQFEGRITQPDMLPMEEGTECSLQIEGEPASLEGIQITKVTEETEEGAETRTYCVIAEIGTDTVHQTGAATLSFTRESPRYQNCVPLSALYRESTGNYILGVKEDVTILGIQDVAERIPVTPIEENGQYVAVKESLSAYSAIVTNASKTIKEGDRVRIIEE